MKFLPVVIAVTLGLIRPPSGENPELPLLTQPRIEVNLARLGWRAFVPESDRSFFRNFSIAKLEATDPDEKIAFLNDEIVVAYHTVQGSQENKDWRFVSREVEAFFIRSSDGLVVAKRQWKTGLRKSLSTHVDSEARIIPVAKDRFLVHADGVLKLYGKDLSMLREKPLDPLGWDDVWRAQGVAGGRYILLRHGKRDRMYATYEWLDSDTLETTHRTESYTVENAVATDDFIIGSSEAGIEKVSYDGHSVLLCQDPICKQRSEFVPLSSGTVAFLAWNRVGVIDLDKGLIWSESVHTKVTLQIGDLRGASSGNRLLFLVGGPKHASFHGEKLGSVFVTFVYDAKRGAPVYGLREERGWYDRALSPDGKQLATLNSDGLRIYSAD